ncbi:MAG: hypothetical protein HYY93_12010 [Planctomycetes bacterium]|nr:hypothetical protein [Planctomycetota bacterium]
MPQNKKAAKKPMGKKQMKSIRGGISEQGLNMIAAHRPFNAPPDTTPPPGTGPG